MTKEKGFLEIEREVPEERSLEERIKDFDVLHPMLDDNQAQNQSTRCMDCGVPFCMSGCPLGNMIPDFNAAVSSGKWSEAARTLHATNNFPEITGHICPAPCESACVLGIIKPPVSIKELEAKIAEKSWEKDYIKAVKPAEKSGKTVAIIGSGPAGLACAQQLNRVGHDITIFEKSLRPGGLLTYGIPEYKLPYKIIEQRMAILKEEGIKFLFGQNVGEDVSFEDLRQQFDAVVMCTGAEKPRELTLESTNLNGIHFAMEFLSQQSDINFSSTNDSKEATITAKDKNVIVIGGGDTGSDCIGTSIRQGATSVTNFEIQQRRPAERTADNPWPQYDFIYRLSSSMAENSHLGGGTHYGLTAKKIISENGKIKSLETIDVQFDGSQVSEVAGTERSWPCDLLLIAIGYCGVNQQEQLRQFGVKISESQTIVTDKNKMTDKQGVFAAGDCRRGQSLVVWAIAEGRDVANRVDSWLMQKPSLLPKVNTSPYAYN